MSARSAVGRIFIGLILLMGGSEVVLGAAPIKLNGALVAGGDVSVPRISPTGDRVIFAADQVTDEVFEIFSVPISGGAPVKLNPTLAANGDVLTGTLLVTPDGSRVIYLADQDTDAVNELYSVPVDGGVSTKISGALVANGDVAFTAVVSPDNSRVLFIADKDADTINELYSVTPTGASLVKLNGALVLNGDVSTGGLQFSPDSSRVLYLADQITDNVAEVFSVPSGGGAATKLNTTPVAGSGGVSASSLQFTPDSSRVVYLADQDVLSESELFSVPATGGTVTQLNGTFATGGDIIVTSSVSPDGSRIVYVADQDVNDVQEIYSVPVAGGAATKLNPPIASDRDVASQVPSISPDSNRVLYRSDQTINDQFDLYIAPLAGGATTQLSSSVTNGNASFYLFSPDGSRVAYTADQDTDNVAELYSVPSTGGPAVKLNGPLVTNGNVINSGLQFTPDGKRIMYLADQNADGVNEAFLVPSTGGVTVRVNDSLVSGGSLSASIAFSPNGSYVMYQADQDTNDVLEIYARVIEATWNSSSGDWNTDANWDNGFSPDEVMQTVVSQPATVSVAGTGNQAFSLDVGGGSGSTVLDLQSNAELTVMNGLTVADGGVVRGDGEVLANSVQIDAGGEVRTAAGERLRMSGPMTVAGRIEAFGTAASPVEMEFDDAVTISAATGNLVARNATLRFNGGLTNGGAVALSFGTTDVLGDVTNSASGAIAVAGNSGVTFYDDVTNSGTLNIHAGSTAVFFGALAGNGNVGGGDVQALGDLLPGASPGLMQFGGDLQMGPLTNLIVEIAGPNAGSQFDKLDITGSAAIAGSIEVALLGGFRPDPNDSFEIVDAAGGRSGQFIGEDFPELYGGFAFEVVYGSETVSVVVAGLPGDYNYDNIVDAADYTVWRNTLHDEGDFLNADGDGDRIVDEDDYILWKAHYGESLGPGSGGLAESRSAIPEPASALLLLLAATLWGGLRSRETV